jgi:hypothetical protein
MLSSLLNVVRTGFGHHAERLQQRANSLMPGGDIDVAGGLYERTMALREPQLPRASLLNILPSDLPQPRPHRVSLGPLIDAVQPRAVVDDLLPEATGPISTVGRPVAMQRIEDPWAGAVAPRPQTPAAIPSPRPAAEAKRDLEEVQGLQRVIEASEALAAGEPPAPGVSARKAGSIAAGRAMVGLNQELAALADDAIDPRAVTLAPPPASQQQPSGHGVVTVTADRPDPMAVRAEAMPVSQTAAPAVVAPYGVKFNEDSTELLSRSPALLNALQTADDLSGRRQQKPPSASAPRADGGTSSAKKQDGDDNGWMLPVLGGAGLLGAGAAAGLALPHLFGGNSQPNPQTPAR